MGDEVPVPDHIFEVIFSKLPIVNLPVCRLVCKAWNDLILNSKFQISKGFIECDYGFDHCRRMHFVDIDTLSPIASFKFGIKDFISIPFHISCNGLLFITKWDNTTWCDGILNPMTNEFFPVTYKLNFYQFCSFGFGFSPKTKEYKCFRVTFDIHSCRSSVEVFRFGTNHQWSLIHDRLPFVLDQHGAYLDGFIYWILRNDTTNKCVVYALEVETESFEPVVVLKLGSIPLSVKIESFNGSIYVIVYIWKLQSPIVQVWRMVEKDSWIKDFVFDDEEKYCLIKLPNLVKAFEDGRMLILIKNEYFCLDKLGRKIKIKTFDPNVSLVKCICHITSFNFDSLQNILTGHE